MKKTRTKKLRDLSYIFARNVFLLTNMVIALVVVLLFVFGDVEAGVFLGVVLLANMLLGLGQDIRAWQALEHLELLTAPRITRQNDDGTEEPVLIEDVKKGDNLILLSGDQIPCDGVLLTANAIEVNEGLITGEARSLPRNAHDRVNAGSIITAGNGTMRVTSAYSESRIARMTEGIKSYSVNQSPIQRAVSVFITYSGYLLIVAMCFIVIFGIERQFAHVLVVKEIGALASTIVPQGLAFAMTLLFAYGAAHLFRRNVLLQEVNATEKLGRIKNLCMDKTGTLTENILSVERVVVPPGHTEEEARLATLAYVNGSGDASQTISAIKVFTQGSYEGRALEALPFSSWRSFGAVQTESKDVRTVVVAGAPEHLLKSIKDEKAHAWLEDLLHTETSQGKRVFCIAIDKGNSVPHDLSHASLTPIAIYIFSAKLRPGISEAIDFFQQRGAHIRIISGDHPETVRAIASFAGVRDSERVVTGAEMESWSREEAMNRIRNYTIFARTLPEQKELIIEALKRDGFTAMVGDGANDALAIKKADLGIAMWEGAPATRQVASVVLMNNSFTALPGGVRLADSIIKNAEIFASIFFEFAFASFFLFVFVSALGYPFPLSPLNITLLNYFTIGIPGILVSYWTIRPTKEAIAPSGRPFFATVLPFTIWSAVLQALTLGAIFLLSPHIMKINGVNIYVLLGAIITGFIFFLFTPRVYRGPTLAKQTTTLTMLAIVEAILLYGVFQFPVLLHFFGAEGSLPKFSELGALGSALAVYTMGQYMLARKFSFEHYHKKVSRS